MEEIQRESEKNTGRREKTREVNVNMYISHRKYKERGKERKRERNKHEDIKTERGTERERERQRTRRILKNEGGGGREGNLFAVSQFVHNSLIPLGSMHIWLIRTAKKR